MLCGGGPVDGNFSFGQRYSQTPQLDPERIKYQLKIHCNLIKSNFAGQIQIGLGNHIRQFKLPKQPLRQPITFTQ